VSNGTDDPDQRADEDAAGLEPIHLSAERVDEIILSAGGTEAILVGGQALGIWVDLLIDPDRLDELGGPVTSKDVDFFGSRHLARELADHLGGRVVEPDPEHVGTPEAALVLYERDGETIQIDIMGRLAGLSNKEIENGWIEQPYGQETDQVLIRILAPMEILLSRIANVTVLRRGTPGAIRQLRIAPHVVEAFIRQRLDAMLDPDNQADPDLIRVLRRIAQGAIRKLIHFGRAPELDRIYLDHGVDLIAHAWALSDHPAWDPKFVEHQMLGAAEEGAAQRARRIEERTRKDPGFLTFGGSGG
jgi:hypothetical protein